MRLDIESMTDEEVLKWFSRDIVGSDSKPRNWDMVIYRVLQILARKSLEAST